MADEEESQLLQQFDAEEEDGEVLLPHDVLRLMTDAWANEKAAAKLLPADSEKMEYLVNQMEHMESNIAQLSAEERDCAKVKVHQMELYRISYMVNSYARTRLRKIEADARGALKLHEERLRAGREPLLDDREVKFAQSLLETNEDLLHSLFLDALPPSMRKMPWPQNDDERRHVFFEVLADDTESLTVPHLQDKDSEVVVELSKGSHHFAPFDCVEESLEKGHIKLV